MDSRAACCRLLRYPIEYWQQHIPRFNYYYISAIASMLSLKRWNASLRMGACVPSLLREAADSWRFLMILAVK